MILPKWFRRALLLGLVVVCVGACGTPGATKAKVDVQSTIETKYYHVSGTTEDEVFASIESAHLHDAEDQSAVGLTSVDSSYTWKPRGDAPCGIDTVTITVRVEVTLPSLEDGAQAAVQSHWPAFLAAVRVHEQHHVDIALDGAAETRRLLETLTPNPDGCTAMATDISRLWEGRRSAIDKEQDDFHTAEAERLAPQRQPLEHRLQSDRDRVTAIQGQLATMDTRLRALQMQMDTDSESLAAIAAVYPRLVLPEPIYSHYNSLLTAYNDGVDAYNSLIGRRNAPAAESNGLIDDANSASDELRWIA